MYLWKTKSTKALILVLALFGVSSPARTATNEARSSVPSALLPKQAALIPVKIGTGVFDFSKITADKVLVVDAESNQIILSRKAEESHPIASITKLMTAMIADRHGLSMGSPGTVLGEDEVGGARLRVDNGTPLTVRDIFYAMLVGSANNAAHALARMTGRPISDFVDEMNAEARALGLSSTLFIDTSGLDPRNTSNAQDIAALAIRAFENPVIRSAVSTASYPLHAGGITRQMKNTNRLLTDANNGLYVLGGKTGYLVESKWNLVVKMKDYRNKPLVIVTLGSATDADAFKDSARIAQWVWSQYQWKKAPPVASSVSSEPVTQSVSGAILPGLYQGVSSAQVRLLQQRLTKYYGIPGDKTNVTGYFGPKTHLLAQRFQLEKKLISSASARDAGYVGPKTAAALNALSK